MVLTVRRDRSWEPEPLVYAPRKRFARRSAPGACARRDFVSGSSLVRNDTGTAAARNVAASDIIGLCAPATTVAPAGPPYISPSSHAHADADAPAAMPSPPHPSSRPRVSSALFDSFSFSVPLPPVVTEESPEGVSDSFDDEPPLRVPGAYSYATPTPTPRMGLVDLPEISGEDPDPDPENEEKDEDEAPVHVEEAPENRSVADGPDGVDGILAPIRVSVNVNLCGLRTDHVEFWDAHPGSYVDVLCDILLEHAPADFLRYWYITDAGVQLFAVSGFASTPSPSPSPSLARSKKGKAYADHSSLCGDGRTHPPSTIKMLIDLYGPDDRLRHRARLKLPAALFEVARDRVFVLTAHFECTARKLKASTQQWEEMNGGPSVPRPRAEPGTKRTFVSESTMFSVSVLRRGVDMAA